MKSQASSKPREMFQEIVVYRHHSGYDQNALKLKKTGSGEGERGEGITIDNIISRQHQQVPRRKDYVIIGEEWG